MRDTFRDAAARLLRDHQPGGYSGVDYLPFKCKCGAAYRASGMQTKTRPDLAQHQADELMSALDRAGYLKDA